MSNHPVPRPASSRDADDDQFGSGTFHYGRFFVFLGTLAALVSLPDECAKRVLAITIATFAVYVLTSIARRRDRHG